MGYPIEIAMAVHARQPVPLEHPVTSRWARCAARIAGWLRRRPRRRADHPERYGQGVSPAWPRIPEGASRGLDIGEIEQYVRTPRA